MDLEGLLHDLHHLRFLAGHVLGEVFEKDVEGHMRVAQPLEGLVGGGVDPHEVPSYDGRMSVAEEDVQIVLKGAGVASVGPSQILGGQVP